MCFIIFPEIHFKSYFSAYVVKSVSSHITYLSAKTTCKADGKQLCPSFVICRDGKYPVGPVRFGDHWTPVKDAYNQWLQIGKNTI